MLFRSVLGVQAELENQEWKVMLSNLNQKNVEVYRYAWIGDYNDPYTFLEIFQQNASMNHSGFADPAYDAALKTAAGTLDLPTRAQQLQEAEKIVTDNYVVMSASSAHTPRRSRGCGRLSSARPRKA